MSSIVVIDDHQMLAQMIAISLKKLGHDAQIADIDGDLFALACNVQADVAMLDLELGPDRPSGSELVGPLADRGIRVLVLSAVSDEVVLAECLERGAYGLINKGTDFDTLTAVIDDCANDHAVGPSDSERVRLSIVLARSRRREDSKYLAFESLTTRERDVLGEMMLGKSGAEIAADAFVSVSTVRSQIKAINQKLGVSSQLRAVALAHQAGWTLQSSH